TYNEGKVTGALTIHGVTKEISVPATLIEENENFVLTTAFDIILAEYNVEIPSAVADKISKAASIQVQATLKSVGK
nr:YceI family protein [Bacteroidota bacterium]